MRSITLLLLGATLGSCATPPPAPTRNAETDRQYQQLIAGRVPGKAVSCMPTFNANDMVVLDESTIAFKSGARVYVAHMQGGCSGVGGPGHYALVTRQVGMTRLCSGDIADVVDTINRFTVGTCIFGDFTPYDRAGR